VSTFLEKVAQHQDIREFHAPYREFQSFAYTKVMRSHLRESIDAAHWEDIMDARGWQLAADVLKSELRALVSKSPCFQKYSHQTQPDSPDSVDSLSQFEPNIKQCAPRWMFLFNAATECSQDSKSAGPKIVTMAVLTHMQQPIKSTNFATILGLYMYHSGAKRRIIDCLSRLGLSISYKTISRIMKTVSAEQRKKVRTLGRDPISLVAYDNYDFAVGRRGERAGDKREHRSIVTALSFRGQEIPAEGLRQSMWRPKNPPQRSLNRERFETGYGVVECKEN
jgi:hypothetical protein